jgi:hypothetical protein
VSADSISTIIARLEYRADATAPYRDRSDLLEGSAAVRAVAGTVTFADLQIAAGAPEGLYRVAFTRAAARTAYSRDFAFTSPGETAPAVVDWSASSKGCVDGAGDTVPACDAYLALDATAAVVGFEFAKQPRLVLYVAGTDFVFRHPAGVFFTAALERNGSALPGALGGSVTVPPAAPPMSPGGREMCVRFVRGGREREMCVRFVRGAKEKDVRPLCTGRGRVRVRYVRLTPRTRRSRRRRATSPLQTSACSPRGPDSASASPRRASRTRSRRPSARCCWPVHEKIDAWM